MLKIKNIDLGAKMKYRIIVHLHSNFVEYIDEISNIPEYVRNIFKADINTCFKGPTSEGDCIAFVTKQITHIEFKKINEDPNDIN